MCIKCNRKFINKAAILSHFRHFHANCTDIKIEKEDVDEVKTEIKKNNSKKVVQKKKKRQDGVANNIDKNKILDKEGRKNRHLKPGFKYKGYFLFLSNIII